VVQEGVADLHQPMELLLSPNSNSHPTARADGSSLEVVQVVEPLAVQMLCTLLRRPSI
jgi:hypothetical protein